MSIDALLITNQKARSGNSDLQQGIDLLYEAGWKIRQEQPEKPERIPDLILQYGPEADRVIIGSGDGTLNHAAEALVEVGRPLGVIPLGTANDLARTLCIPTDPVEACQIIRDGHLHKIDLGYVNGKYFFNVASIGLGEMVTRRLSSDNKRRWGVLAYLHSFIDAFKSNRRFRVSLTCDGRREKFSSIQVAVANGRHYGGGMTVDEDARIDDHLLHFFSLKPQSLFSIAMVALALRKGQIQGKKQVVFREGCELEVRTRKPMRINTDGELTSRTPARFSVRRDALSVYVPIGYEDNVNCQ